MPVQPENHNHEECKVLLKKEMQIPQNVLRSDCDETQRSNQLLQINADISTQRCTSHQ